AESLISARFCERLRASTKARFPAAVRERRFLWASAATTDLIDRTATLGCNCMTCPRNTKVRAQLPALHMLAAAMLLASGAQAKAPVDWDLLDEYCVSCHNYADFAGSIAFDLMNQDSLLHDAEDWELVIRKVRTGMMPPAGEPRPPRVVLDAFTQNLGMALDIEYEANPNPGNEGLARLNREEYRNAIRDLLNFDASHIVANIPGESAGEGFDNNIELLSVSPTLIDAF